jgi:L-amino acid N-acyltransferase YncA
VAESAATIRAATAADAAAIARIYNPYVRETVITFEEAEVKADEMASRIADVAAASLPWLVREVDGRLTGYAYATRWKARSAYRFSVETTVYADREQLGAGAGTALYEALFEELRKREVNAVIGGIALPNERSVALHEKFGMKKVAHFEQVGFKFGRWVDVGYWQTRLGR